MAGGYADRLCRILGNHLEVVSRYWEGEEGGMGFTYDSKGQALDFVCAKLRIECG